MTCKVSASQSGPCPRFSYFCHHISQIWCHDAISPFWSLSFCHSVHLFERPRCYACVPETCHFSIWSWSSINIYIISLSSHQRVARCRPHTIFPLKAMMLHTANAIIYRSARLRSELHILSLILSRSRSTSVENTEQKNREISVPFLWYKNALKTAYY